MPGPAVGQVRLGWSVVSPQWCVDPRLEQSCIMKIRNRFLKLFFNINRKFKLIVVRKDIFTRSVVRENNIINEKFSDQNSEFDVELLEDMMKTSTPVKTEPIKMIAFQDHSHFKIYEEYDYEEPFHNKSENNFEDFSISHENLRISDYDNLALEETGFKIYEDIGESFAVDQYSNEIK